MKDIIQDNKLLIKQHCNKQVKVGDIFILQPSEGLYFFGKVIETNIRSKTINLFHKGCDVLFIYNVASIKKDIPADLEKYHLIDIPRIYLPIWSLGYTEIIGNRYITQEDYAKDYGFYSHFYPGYLNANGSQMDHEPKIKVNFDHIATLAGIGNTLHQKLVQGEYEMVPGEKYLYIPPIIEAKPSNFDSLEIKYDTLKDIKGENFFIKLLSGHDNDFDYEYNQQVKKYMLAFDTYIEDLIRAKMNEADIIRAIKKLVLTYNRFERKHAIIDTDARESCIALILYSAKIAGFEGKEIDITENWRDW